MSAATPLHADASRSEPVEVTLLELVHAVTDVADNENEVIATVVYMLRTGSARLRGNFRGCRIV